MVCWIFVTKKFHSYIKYTILWYLWTVLMKSWKKEWGTWSVVYSRGSKCRQLRWLEIVIWRVRTQGSKSAQASYKTTKANKVFVNNTCGICGVFSLVNSLVLLIKLKDKCFFYNYMYHEFLFGYVFITSTHSGREKYHNNKCSFPHRVLHLRGFTWPAGVV